jgi:hypothetical protein
MPCLAFPFEELHRALVLLRGRARFESAQIPTPAGPAIDLSGVEAVTAGSELPDHPDSTPE